MTDIATNEPAQFVAGDTVQWKKVLPDYKASAGWVLTYYFINAAGKKTAVGVMSGDDHLITIAAADSANYPAGNYQWQARAVNGDQSTLIDFGNIKVLPNFAALTTLDNRGHARKVLDAIEAVLENRATKDQQEYQIASRRLALTPIPDLIMLRDKYRAEVKREEIAERLRNGLAAPNKIKVRI